MLSFEALGPVRREFLRRLNVVKKDLRSADQAFEELRRLDLAPLLGEKLRPRLPAFPASSWTCFSAATARCFSVTPL